MTDATIACPNCGTEIPLTASLAAPLIAASKREYEERLAAKDAEIATREKSFQDREAAVAKAEQAVEAKLAARLTEERGKIAAEEARKAKAENDAVVAELQETLKQRNDKVAELQKGQLELARKQQELEDAKAEMDVIIADKIREGREKIAADAEKRARAALQENLDARAAELADLQALATSQREKLQAAQAEQAALLKKQRELEEAKAQVELDIQKGIQAGLELTRSKALKEAEEAASLKLAESQHTIDAMKRQIEDLKRKAEQGSQQLQGEVQELELEAQLSAQFPLDTIAPVPKGEFGGDTLQTVHGPLGTACGSILWESKRTKAWSDGWIQKLKDDQRAAKAEVAIIISQTLPKGVETFDLIDGVWVSSPRCAVPVAICLRQSLIELSLARQARVGQESKMEAVYEYLTGPHYRQRVQAIVEGFSAMKDDLAKEKRAIQKQWSKRETQIERVLIATAGNCWTMTTT